jgi:GAF domain-containing protein
VSHPDREPDRERRLSRAFVTLADTLVDDYDIIDLLDRLVHHSVDLLAAEAAGIVLGDSHGELRALAASSEDAHTMELLQLQSDEGPCMDCYLNASPVSVPDLHEVAHRWPVFVAAVARAGAFRSVHAVPLRLRGHAVGALNLFHRLPGRLPDDDLDLAQALADVATIGILQERSIRHGEVVTEQLQTALNSRVIIEQANGVISQSLAVDMEVAFNRLRSYTRARNLRIAVVARAVVLREIDPHALLELPETSDHDEVSTRPRRRLG